MEKIVPVNVGEQFKTDYQRYGIYVTYKRILSDMRDGLKPVQRRVLYTMLDIGATDHTVKSATITGSCMRFHPHGNCISGDIVISSLDGNTYTMEQLFQSGKPIHVMSINPVTGEVVPSIAHSFRIGQYTNKIYHICLSNGTEIKCTGNHPFMVADGSFVEAKDLKKNSRLNIKTISISKNGRPYIDGIGVHQIVHDYYFGIPQSGYERHHRDENVLNNTPENLIALTSKNHRITHFNSERSQIYLDALEVGRNNMFREDGKYRDSVRKKNRRLAKILSSHQSLLKIKMAFKLLEDRGMSITIDNYESLRSSKEIYNLPIISRFLKNHPEYGCKTFEDIISCNVPDIGALYCEEIDKESIDEISEAMAMSKAMIAKTNMFMVLNEMVDEGIPLTVENYIRSLIESKNSNIDQIQAIIDVYKMENPYIERIWIENVQNVPMYDFTVYGYENMIIPMYSQQSDNRIIPAICIHNSSIYDSMKSMTNWFECYLPLLSRQGNFGSFFGEPASAERYTESKLSNFALDYVVGDLRDAPESVDWEPNYDNTLKEPSYLPAAIPLLLINGSFGIGLGKKVDIPSHNTNEVIDAMIGLIRNPNMPVTLIPDTCMNCEIFDDSNWEEISNTGYGYFTVRGIAKIETYSNDKYKNRPAVVIYSVPDMIYIDRIKEQIEKLVEKKKLVQIDDMYDESSEYKPRFVIVLKQGSDPEYVRNVLYQNTFLQVTQRINFEFLNGLTPVRLSYKDYLLNFIENRKQVKYRVFINRLRVIETKMHEKEAFIKLLESPKFEEIMDKIRRFNKDNKELVEYLIKQLNITDVQARYIIDSRLSSLTRNSLGKLKADMKNFTDLRDSYMELVVNENSLIEYIIAELEQIKAKYGCERRSKLIHKPGSKDAIPTGLMIIAITEKGYIKKVPNGSPLGNFRNDVVKSVINIDNADNLVIFDSSGKVYKLPIYKLPFGDKNSSGIDLKFIFKSFNGVAVNAFPESTLKGFMQKNKTKDRFCVITLTKQGFIKKMEVEEFFNITSAGLTYAKMDSGDYIQSVCLIHSTSDIIVFNNTKAMRIASDSIPTMKRAARGNMTMKSKDAEGLSVGSVSMFEFVIVVTKSGKINKIPVKGVPGLQANKREFSLIRLGKNDMIQNIIFADANQTLTIKCLKSGEFSFPVSTIAMGSSITGGDKVLSLKNDQIIYSTIS